MGEKGNVTSEELAVATLAGGGAVVAGSGTAVTAVFEEAATSVKDKVIDKGADAGIVSAQEAWRRRHPKDAAPSSSDEGHDDPTR